MEVIDGVDAIDAIVVIVAIDVIVVIVAIGVISRRGRLRTRTLHSQTVCSKLPAGETPASPVGVVLAFLCCCLGRDGDRPSLGAFSRLFFRVVFESFSSRFRD